MKKRNIYTTLGAYLFQRSIIGYLNDIANLEILPYGLHFSEVMSFTKIIQDVDGLYIYNSLLHGYGAITRMLAYCKILAR